MIKNLLPKSLLGRSLLIIVAPLILLQIITTFIFFDRHWQTMSKRLSGSLAGKIAIIIDAVKTHATLGEISDTLREVFGEY